MKGAKFSKIQLCLHGALYLLVIAATLFSNSYTWAEKMETQKAYFVAPNGDDANDGTISKPFRTVGKGVSVLKPGETLYLREGRYYEEVRIKGLRGESDKPITIRPYKKEEALFDGTIELKNLTWTKHPTVPNVWQAKIDRDIWQLFVDGRMMINARWPNAEHPFENEEKSSWWDRGRSWCHVQHKIDEKVVSGFDFERAVGFLVEDGIKGLAAMGRSFVGCMGVLNVNSMTTLVGRISKHEKGSAYFEYEVNEQLQDEVRDPKKENLRRILTKNVSHAYFYFEGWADLIDTPDEWAYDKETKTLYLYANDASQLKHKALRGKVQTAAVSLEGCKYVTLKGFDFFGTCIQAFDCTHVAIEDNVFDYPSYSQRMLGSLEKIETITMSKTTEGKRGKTDTGTSENEDTKEEGTYNVFRNNIVRYADGMGLHLDDGAFDLVDNNLFQYIDISGTPGGSVGVTVNGMQNTFSRNTLEFCGSSKAIKAGAAGFNILNRISRFGYLQDDGTAIQSAGRGQQGVIYTQNWAHDSPKSGFRFDGSEKSDAFERNTYNGSMVRNVIFNNNGGLMVKGDDHRVYSNLCYNVQNDAYKVLTHPDSPHSNHETITRNNIGDYINASRRDDPLENPPVGPTDHNWMSHYPKRDIREILRDPDNLDFRPRADAKEIIDAGVDVPQETLRCGATLPDFTSEFKIGKAPDIGPYEFGAKNYWIAGFNGPKASTPIPPDGATTAKPDADLMWLPAYRSESFKVYLGTTLNNMKLVSEQDNNIYDPGPLDPTITYYWRVDCNTPDGWAAGDVWKFRARGLPFRRGGSLTGSYVETFAEVYDFDQNNLEKNVRGLIIPWIHPKYNSDRLDLVEGGIAIIPDLNRSRPFEPVTIPNVNIDLARYPFLSFKYKTPQRKEAIGFYTGFTVSGGKARDVFHEKPFITLKSSPEEFTSVFLDLTELVKESNETFGSAMAKNILLQITGPDDASWKKADGAFIISDFKIGFACLLDKVESVNITGQRYPVVSEGQPVVVSPEFMKIAVTIQGDKNTYVFPPHDTFPVSWEFRLGSGKNYTIVDGDTIKPVSGFKGTLTIPVVVRAGNKTSNTYSMKVIVR